jgi:cellobiose phosphorylase
VGRGGWTWYTGAAGWLYRVGLETILGLTRRGGALCIEPRVPNDWSGFSIEYRYRSTVYSITVLEPGRIPAAGADVSVDGRRLDDTLVPLVDDGHRHEVVVRPRGPGRHTP